MNRGARQELGDLDGSEMRTVGDLALEVTGGCKHKGEEVVVVVVEEEWRLW